MRHCTRAAALSLLLAAPLVFLPAAGPDKAAAVKGAGWTLDEAMSQLRLYPRDPYLQYVALQLGRREGTADQIASQIQALQGQPVFAPNERAAGVDLFSLFSGALAVQESLQLDTMRGERQPNPRRRRAPDFKGDDPKDTHRADEKVALTALTGPTIKSHPWQKMLAGRKPDVGTLAKCVPDDFYFVEFRSLAKLLTVIDEGDLWGTHLISQTVQEAKSSLVADRLKKQLALETTGLLRPFYDSVVREVAITGSDLYFREGSDVTLLFKFAQPEVFKLRMNGFLASAEKANAGCKRTEGKYLDVPYVHVSTADRTVDVYSAYPAPDLHVRTNSLVALKRVLEAVAGKVTRLGDTDEFAYIRTIYLRGAKEEDGFVYLSDPFIRRQVGPLVKLTERRRMVAYNHLRMIGHAALMYRTEHGKVAASLDELIKAGCAPEIGKGDLVCPDGGKYSLAADGLTGVCSKHGTAQFLTPCCEIAVKEVTGDEANEYKAFLDEYNRYWQTFFDPIALRLQATPKGHRMETIVLPLLDNSVYTTLARTMGGKPEPLDALPVPKRTIFSVAARLDKRALLETMGLTEFLPDVKEDRPAAAPALDAATTQAATRLQQLGLAMHNYHDTFGFFPTAVSFDKAGKKTGLSWRVHLLPYLEQDNLYKAFKLDESWDSEHNKKLIARMPELYRPASAKLAKEGKTCLVGPLGDDLMFPKANKKVKLTDVLDGTSNTIMVVEADDDHAVIWTKPDDLEVDLKKPLAGLAVRQPGAFLVLLADGSVRFLRKSIAPKTLAALFTAAGGETVSIEDRDEIPVRFQGPPDLLASDVLTRLKLGELLTKGVGNQVGMHVYDAEQLFDFNLPSFLGLMFGSFGRGAQNLGSSEMMFVPMAASLNSPVYVSVPVKDTKVVDEFLARLDGVLAEWSRTRFGPGGMFRVEQDFYHFASPEGKNFRAYGFRFGPVKWRVYWGRIGNGLYFASKPYILDDLLAADRAGPSGDNGPTAHGLVRLRPKHWDRVLDDYQRGWAEGCREACVHNLGPLASLSRAQPADKRDEAGLAALSARAFGVRYFCPDGGSYVASEDGKAVACSLHGTARNPRQQAAAAKGRRPSEFSDMTLSLTFLEDGLHAVVTVDRK